MLKHTSFVFLTIVLIGFQACQPENKKQTAQKPKKATASTALDSKRLVGKWQSTEDPRNFVEFTEWGTFKEINGTDVLADAPYTLDSTCAEKNKPDLGCFGFKDKDGEWKYSFIKITPDALAYTQIGGAGNTLSYKKVKDEQK